MDVTPRRAAWSAVWIGLTLLCGAAAVPIWLAALTPGSKSPAWLALIFTALTVVAIYMSIAHLTSRWPTVSKSDQAAKIDLEPEQVDDYLRLTLVNHGSAAEFSIQVTAIVDPLGRKKTPQNWTIPWLEDNSTEPKRILTGARQVLDFARYDADAVNAELSTGQGDASHWWFSAAPTPVGARYFNLHSQNDIELQFFIVSVRIMNASSEKYHDRRLAVRIQGGNLLCEVAPVSASE